MLASQPGTELDLVQMREVESANVRRFILASLAGEPEPQKTLRSEVDTTQNVVAFRWTRSQDGWEECVGLVDGLSDGPGHQYLTIEGVDDALVELAFMEDDIIHTP